MRARTMSLWVVVAALVGCGAEPRKVVEPTPDDDGVVRFELVTDDIELARTVLRTHARDAGCGDVRDENGAVVARCPRDVMIGVGAGDSGTVRVACTGLSRSECRRLWKKIVDAADAAVKK